jgi:hypothetical protein
VRFCILIGAFLNRRSEEILVASTLAGIFLFGALTSIQIFRASLIDESFVSSTGRAYAAGSAAEQIAFYATLMATIMLSLLIGSMGMRALLGLPLIPGSGNGISASNQEETPADDTHENAA